MDRAGREARQGRGRHGKILASGWELALPDGEQDWFLDAIRRDEILKWRWQQLKLKARICSRKRLLISDPRIQHMTKTRWLFEGWQVRLEEESKAKFVMQVGTEAVKAFQQVLVSVLGVNLEPIAEPDPEKPGEPKYRWPKEGEFTPLIMAIARPDYVSAAMEKVAKVMPEMMSEDANAPPPLVSEEDLEFFDDLDVDQRKAFWNSMEMQQQLKQYVIQKDPDTVDPLAAQQPKPVGLTDTDREALQQHQTERMPSKMRFQIDAADDLDDLSSFEPPKRK